MILDILLKSGIIYAGSFKGFSICYYQQRVHLETKFAPIPPPNFSSKFIKIFSVSMQRLNNPLRKVISLKERKRV